MNIQELAREVGLINHYGGREIASDDLLERFADLVLEEAADECDKRAHAGDAGALMAARAIRALKGAKE